MASLAELAVPIGTFMATQGAIDTYTRGKAEATLASLDRAKPDAKTIGIVKEFLREQGIVDNKVKINFSDSNGYNPVKGEMSLATRDPAVALHETGHAIQNIKYPKLSRTGLAISKYAPPTAAAAAAIAFLTGDNKSSDTINKYAPLALLVASTPEVALEYDASRRAKKFMQSHYPELSEQANKKLDKALETYIINAVSTPAAWAAAWAASNIASGFVKKSGLGTVAAKGVRFAGGAIADSIGRTGRVIRDVGTSKGVIGKFKAAGRSLLGESDGKPTTIGGKLMRAGETGLVLSTPVLAAYGISKAPKDPEVWGREIGTAVGEVLGGGKLLGGAALAPTVGSKGAEYGRKIKEFITPSK